MVFYLLEGSQLDKMLDWACGIAYCDGNPVMFKRISIKPKVNINNVENFPLSRFDSGGQLQTRV